MAHQHKIGHSVPYVVIQLTVNWNIFNLSVFWKNTNKNCGT